MNKIDKETSIFFNRYYSSSSALRDDDSLDVVLNEHRLHIPQMICKEIKSHIIDKKIRRAKILDFGCGEGDYLFYINNQFSRMGLFGYDVSDEAIKKAKKNLKKHKISSPEPYIGNIQIVDNKNAITFKYGDLSKIIPGEKFDLVFLVSVLHHINDYSDAITNISQLLKKDGVLLIYDLKGHSRIFSYLKNNLLRIIPVPTLEKVFKNDLILEDGNIPTRSDVTLNKTINIMNAASIKPLSAKGKTFEIFNYILIALQFLYRLKLINFFWINKIYRYINSADKIMSKKFPNYCEIFYIVAKKTQ